MDHPARKSPRLQNFDYSSNGAYFITICTCGRRRLLSSVIPGNEMKRAENPLTPCGKAAEEELRKLEGHFNGVHLEKYVIMPNHIHAIILLEDSDKTLSEIVAAYKSLAAKTCRKQWNIFPLFQRSFHDHVIRGREDYEKIWNYIDTNPDRWEKDIFFQ